ncbi:MAG TPA: alpha/beta fold hydrolase [Gaiellaceae bacterium]|nr:alpha/beta fold hydrolase [Gaiellaceae bacterium]
MKRFTRIAAWLAVVAALVATVASAQAGTAHHGKGKGHHHGKGPRVCCTETHVDIQANGYTIPGTFTLPRAGGHHGRYPAVLLLHGTASQKDEVGNMYARVAQKLGRLGYASLRIDFAGSGDSTLPQTAFTYAEEVSDAKTALTWLSGNRNVNAGALGLVGFSQGGRVAATVAGTDPRVKALATWSTWVEDGSTAYLIWGPGAYQEAQQNGHVVVDLGFRTWDFSLAWFDTIKASDPLQDIAAYHGPLLGIDGSEDELWPQTKDELYAAGSYDETLHVVPGADHIYHVLDADQTQAEDVLDTTATWFSQKLAPHAHHGH